jgi:hypothetical protein
MPAAVVDRILRGGKRRIGECPYCDAHRALPAFLGVKNSRPAYGAKSEFESLALIAGAHEFGSSAGHLERRRETGQRSEYASRAALTGQTMADTNPKWGAMNFDAQLSAATGSNFRWHGKPRK